MGRKSRAAERRTEALDAFEVLVAKEGLAGTTLGRLADQLGWHKPLLTHYFGTRDVLVELAVMRIRDRWFAKLDELDSQADLEALIDYFCRFADNPANRVLDALFDASHRDAQIRAVLQGFHKSFIQRIGKWLRHANPELSTAASRRRATTLLALVLGGKKLGPLDLPTEPVRQTIREIAMTC